MYIPIFKRYLKSSKLGVLHFIRQKRRKEGMVNTDQVECLLLYFDSFEARFPKETSDYNLTFHGETNPWKE